MSDTDWQIQCKSLAEKNLHLLNSGLCSDCSFRVGCSSEQSQMFKAHKVILTSSSPVFQAMLFGSMAETKETIEIKDVEPEAFAALLRYMYTDRVNILSVDAACEIYYIADKYMLVVLMEQCLQYIYTHLTTSSVWKTYEFAKFNNKSQINKKCLRIIKNRSDEALLDDSFSEVDIETVLEIFDLPDLNISSEVILFKAIDKYYQSFTERSSQSVSVESDPTGSPPLTIWNAVQKIRFLNITPQEFARAMSETCLLTDVDGFGVVMNILDPECKIPIPDGFSVSRVTRKQRRLERLVGKHFSMILDEQQKLNVVDQLRIHFNKVFIFCDGDTSIKKVCAKIISSHNIYIIHEDMESSERNRIIQQYKNAILSARLISPATLASCINMDAVYCTINYELPSNEVDYVHTVARQKNIGKPVTINLIAKNEEQNLKNIEDYYSIEIQNIPFSTTVGSDINNYRQ